MEDRKMTEPKTHPGYQEVLNRAWSDPEFKARLKSDPAAVLRAAGVPLPKGMTIAVVENTPDVMHMVLPISPDDADFEVVLPGKVGAMRAQGEGEITVRCGKCCTLEDVLREHG
jgi:hypothetical protein